MSGFIVATCSDGGVWRSENCWQHRMRSRISSRLWFSRSRRKKNKRMLWFSQQHIFHILFQPCTHNDVYMWYCVIGSTLVRYKSPCSRYIFSMVGFVAKEGRHVLIDEHTDSQLEFALSQARTCSQHCSEWKIGYNKSSSVSLSRDSFLGAFLVWISLHCCWVTYQNRCMVGTWSGGEEMSISTLLGYYERIRR